jgi:hypothetical protein
LSDVRRDSGGDISPDIGCVGGAGQPEVYGGGGLFEYIEVGLTRAAAAMLDVEVYAWSVLMRSKFSRLINDNIPLRTM